MISLLSDRFPHLLIGIKVAKSGVFSRDCPAPDMDFSTKV